MGREEKKERMAATREGEANMEMMGGWEMGSDVSLHPFTVAIIFPFY